MLPDALRVCIASARSAQATQAPVVADAASASSFQSGAGLIAVLPVSGPVSYRPSLFSYFFGGAVIETLQKQLQAAISDPQVRAILLRIDSPGGMVSGVTEFAAELRAAKAVKPILALADTTAASAAYWLAAQATEVWAVPSADVGSVGVYAIHEDFSRMLEQDGVTVTLISAGEHKTDGNPYEPLSQDARADMQRRVDQVYEQFLADVSEGRRVSTDRVRESFGQGRLLGADEALQAGLIDRIGTFREALGRAGRMKVATQAAADDLDVRARRLSLVTLGS